MIIDVIQGFEFRTEGKRKGDMDMAMIARRSSEGWGNFGKTVSQKGEDGEYLQGFLNRFQFFEHNLNTKIHCNSQFFSLLNPDAPSDLAEIPGWSAGLVTKEFGPSSGGNCSERINGYCIPACLLPITF